MSETIPIPDHIKKQLRASTRAIAEMNEADCVVVLMQIGDEKFIMTEGGQFAGAMLVFDGARQCAKWMRDNIKEEAK